MKTPSAVLFAILLLAGRPAAGFAADSGVDSRESAADRALGGMEEGSRMPEPGGSFGEEGRKVPGSVLSPGTDTRSFSPAGAGTSAGPGAGAGAGFGAGSGRGTDTVAAPGIEPATPGSAESGGLENSGGSGDLGGGTGGGDLGGGTETDSSPSGGGSIIDIGADVSTDGGTVDANLDAGINTEADSLLELDAATDVAITEEPVALELDSAESAVIETDLGVEEGINEAPASGEVEAGIEADVDASGESDEPVSSPGGGLSL